VRHLRDILPWPFRRFAALAERRLLRALGRLGLKADALHALVEAGQTYVAPTGGMANIYLDPDGRRLTLEEVERAHPALVGALLGLDGVSSVVGRTDRGGIVIVSAKGRLTVGSTGAVAMLEGEHPLAASFDPEATLADIERLVAIGDAGDLVVFAGPLSDRRRRRKHLNFAEQFGGHGGISAAEQNAFLIGPAARAEQIGRVREPEDLYELLRGYAQR
jgi:hypothetical protein